MLTLAIVGRPNVGKSTLFNRLAGKKLAIINDTPGVTRDWREAEAYLGETFRVLDTAGLEEKFDDSIQGKMRKQTESALKQADVILFMVDGRAGITPLDEHFAGWLRKQNLPVILGINKCENEKITLSAQAESYKLGLGEPIMLSAEHGTGLDELYHMLRPYLKDAAIDSEADNDDALPSDEALDDLEGREDYDFAAGIVEDETKPIKIAIVGRPNVGKSTMMNALLGTERVMTSPEAGTTRDAVAAHWTYKDRFFRLVDTAGMRKQARIYDPIEKMSVDDTLRAIRLAQVVILVLDGNQKMEKQDLLIAEHVLDEGRALVIAVNKWDSVEDRTKSQEDINNRLMASLAQVPNVPLVMLSALKGKNLDRMMDEVIRIYGVWNGRAATARLNKWLAHMESKHPAPLINGKPNRLKYITQIKSRPPTFALWMSRPGDLSETYKRYLINGLREDYDLRGIPIRILVRASKNPYSN